MTDETVAVKNEAPFVVTMLRRGEDPKLAPEQEQALLDKLRRQREEKSHAGLQTEAQTLSASMAHMDLNDLLDVAKETCAKSVPMAFAPLDGNVALVLNVIMRSCCPPDLTKTSKKGKGGGKKQQNSIKAAAAKVVEGAPPEAALVRKAIKANKALLSKATKGAPAGQTAILNALMAWLTSPQGANACDKAAKVCEVLYDCDLVEEEVFTKFWETLQSQLEREAAELAEAAAALETLTVDKAAAQEEMKRADKEQADAAQHEKWAEQSAQAARCGGNPSKEDEIAEKAALNHVKKCKDYRTQTSKVAAARSKALTEVSAEFETSQRLVEQLTTKAEGGGALFTKKAKPFFDWLAAPDEEDSDGGDAAAPSAASDPPVLT